MKVFYKFSNVEIPPYNDNDTIILSIYNIDTFIKSLEFMKEKLEEWSKVAIENNVTNIDKNIDIATGIGSITIKSEGIEYTSDNEVKIKFSSTSNKGIITYNIFISAMGLKSLQKKPFPPKFEYVLLTGGALWFNSVGQIDTLIEAMKLAKEKIKQNENAQKEYLEKKKNTDDLFK